MSDLLEGALSLAPVFLFLLALFLLDSYKLVPRRTLLVAIGAGAAAALACGLVARELRGRGVVEATAYLRYLAPLLEETAKALLVVGAIRLRRVGFLVDAAILGFGVGAGFAAVENAYYLTTVDEPNLLVWGIRGFGTATLHGGATAILAIVSKLLAELRASERAWIFLPGLGIAVISHALFNHFVLPPVVLTLLILTTFPLLIVLVFARSEHLLRHWLEVGFSSDVEILGMIRSGELHHTRLGHYLHTLRDCFPGEVRADMLCYLQMRVELSIKAKGRLLMKQAGFAAPPDAEIGDRLKELAFLEHSIGTTGMLALSPILQTSSRELWELYTLGGGRSR